MPIEEFGPGDFPGTTSLGEATKPMPAQTPDAASVLGAAFRESGPMGAVVGMTGGFGELAPQPGYNPYQHPAVKGTRYERDYGPVFAGDQSPAETEARIARIDHVEGDRKLLGSAGWGGTVAQMGMGLLDPTNWLLPAGEIATATRSGASVLRSAASVGAAGALQGAVQEGIEQAIDPTRTLSQSALSIGAQTVFAGMVGAGASRLLSGAETRVAARRLEATREALADSTALTPPHLAGDAEAIVAGDIGRGVEAPDVAANGNTLAAAAGAAATDTREARLVSYGLNRVPILGSVVERVDPVIRTMTSGLTTTRRAVADLAELALSTVDNAVVRNAAGDIVQDAMPTARTGVGPAETEIKLARTQINVGLGDVIDDAWTRYRFGDEKVPMLAGERAALSSWLGRDERLTQGQFREEVGKAMRRGDQSEVPGVADVARWVRENVFEPWKGRAQKARRSDGQTLLPEDLPDPKTAESYFTRIWNKEALRSRPEEFVNKTADWLGEEQGRKAGLQQQLDGHDAALRQATAEGARLRGQLARLDAREREIEAALKERSVELGRAEGRADALDERLSDQGAELSDLAEAVSALRAQARDPATLERVEALRKQAAALQEEERRSRMSPAAADRAEEQELRGRFLATEDDRAFADMVMGRKNPPKEPSFARYIERAGGIRDDAGEVAAIAGDPKLTRRLTSRDLEARTLDDWGEKLHQDYPAAFPDRPTPREVLDALDGALRGREPHWFVEGELTSHDMHLRELASVARDTRAEMERLGYGTDSRLGVARFLADHSEAEPAGPRPFDDIPASIRADAGVFSLDHEHANLEDIRRAVGVARTRSETVEGAASRSRVRQSEAGVALGASERRRDVLSARQMIASERRRVLEDAISLSDEMHGRVRGDMEAAVREWGGNSAAEAVTALRSRDKAMADRAAAAAAKGEPAPAGRLASADSAVDGAVRRILGSDRDLSRQELVERAREIHNRIISSPDGRLSYTDASTGGSGFSPVSGRAAPRGALASRDFMIPDEAIEEFLENDIEHVVRSFMRGPASDIVLTERFGDHMMTDQIRAIMDEANAAVVGKGEEAARKIFRDRDDDIRDLAAMRDRIRGTFALQGSSRMENAARIGRMVRAFNGLADLGGAAISSVPDVAGAVFRYGFTTVFGDAYRPWVKGLVGASEGWKLAKDQYRAMGIAVETALATRSVALDEMSAMYKPASRLERALQAGSEKMQLANLQAPWTDFTKTVASITSGNEILRAARAVVEESATDKQVRDLATSNISRSMARKIWVEFQGAGGEIVDGVHLPNTGQWRDRNAKLAFEGAVMRESNITVVTPGQEKPLWLSDPIIGILGQHKSFVFASTQRIMMANLQRADAATLSGLMTAVSAGMLAYMLYGVSTGKELDWSAGNLMKEGIARSSVLGWFDEVNNIVAKATRGGVDLYRPLSPQPLSKFTSQTLMSQLLGPTAGKIEALTKVTGAPFAQEGWDARTTEAARRLLPAQNLIGVRRLLNEVEDHTNSFFGITPLDRSAPAH